MKTHELKSWPHLFESIRIGEKLHELRRDDRNFQVDDTLRLREFIPENATYTGREQEAIITYITSAENPCALSDKGLAEGYCILSIVLK